MRSGQRALCFALLFSHGDHPRSVHVVLAIKTLASVQLTIRAIFNCIYVAGLRPDSTIHEISYLQHCVAYSVVIGVVAVAARCDGGCRSFTICTDAD